MIFSTRSSGEVVRDPSPLNFGQTPEFLHLFGSLSFSFLASVKVTFKEAIVSKKVCEGIGQWGGSQPMNDHTQKGGYASTMSHPSK